MRSDCIRRGLLLAGLCALFPLKEAGAGPAQAPVPVSREPKAAPGTPKESPDSGAKSAAKVADGKSVVVSGKKSTKPFYVPESKSAVSLGSGGSKGAKPAGSTAGRGGTLPAPVSTAPQKPAPDGPRAGVKTVPPPRLEAFHPRPPERQRVDSASVDELKWTRFSTGRDDYFPVARVLGCNAPLVKQVTEMRLAMDVGFPRRPPKLPRIVLDLPPARPVSQTPTPPQGRVPGPDSEVAIEFFSEPAARTGVDIGMETVVLPIFRVAQPPPIPPVQSRANLRQE